MSSIEKAYIYRQVNILQDLQLLVSLKVHKHHNPALKVEIWEVEHVSHGATLWTECGEFFLQGDHTPQTPCPYYNKLGGFSGNSPTLLLEPKTVLSLGFDCRNNFLHF